MDYPFSRTVAPFGTRLTTERSVEIRRPVPVVLVVVLVNVPGWERRSRYTLVIGIVYLIAISL